MNKIHSTNSSHWYKLTIYNLTKEQAEVIKEGLPKLQLKDMLLEIKKQIHGKKI